MKLELMHDHWSDAATIRKRQIESGIDITFHKVFLPIYYRLLDNKKSLKGLDIGAGTGHLASMLQSFFSELIAIEPSVGMFNIAKEVLSGSSVKIHNVSTYDYQSLADFDFVYSHMCAHTINNLKEFISSSSKFLKTDGCFVFSIPHPCFYHFYKNYFGDEFEYKVEKSTLVRLSISSDESTLMEGIPYIHRPLEMYIESLASAGLTVQNFIEVFPEDNIHQLYSKKWKAPRYCFFVCGF